MGTKRGITREAPELYPFEETRQALYEGAKHVVTVVQKWQPYKLSPSSESKKEHLVFDKSSGLGRRVSKGGTIEDVLKLLDF